jgi:hypothetical protein
MHDLNEEASKLNQFIKLSKEQHVYRHADHNVLRADVDWAASHFLAQLLFTSEIIPCTYFSIDEARELHREFVKTNDKTDLDGLINKFWIRVVGNMVEIPIGIARMADRYTKIKDAEVEFNFLSETSKVLKSDDEITTVVFQNLKETYQHEEGVSISIEKCKEFHFLTEKNNQIKINNLKRDKRIFKYSQQLSFIELLLEKKRQGSVYRLSLSHEKLDLIHTQHKSLFPKTPPLNTLTTNNLVVYDEEYCYLNLRNPEPNYWTTLTDKVGLLLWSLMKEDDKTGSTKNVLKEWILKMRYLDNFILSPKLMSHEERDFFLKDCLYLLLQEVDLVGKEQEFSKLILSQRDWENIFNITNLTIEIPDLTKAGNIFSLYDFVDGFDNIFHNSLWDQGERWYVDMLIQLIVLCDNDSGNSLYNIPTIKTLLSESFTRPYLLWRSCFYIYEWKPEIIPYLCLDQEIASLAFRLFTASKIASEFSPNQSTDIKKEALCRCFGLIISTLQHSPNLSCADGALIVFECLIKVAEQKWKHYSKQPTTSVLQKRDVSTKLLNQLIEVLKDKKPRSDSYLSNILFWLFKNIKEYDSYKNYPQGVIGLPCTKMDMYSFTLQLLLSTEYQNKKRETDNMFMRELVTQFHADYLAAINLKTAPRWNFDASQMKESVPIWSTVQKGVDIIKWESWVLLFEKYDLLLDFLNPSGLKLENTEDEWNKYNQFVVNKIRQHLAILILSHQRLRSDEFTYKRQGFNVQSTLTEIEQAIVRLVSKFSIQDTVEGKLDIFSSRYERSVDVEDEALLPILAQAVNKFDSKHKEEILKSLINADSISKCLKILDYLSSEVDVSFVKKQIKDFDVSHYLDGKNNIPEIETVVLRLAENEEFMEKTKEAAEYWKERVLSKRNGAEYQITYFRIKLLVAYYEGDEQAILSENSFSYDSFSTSKGFEFDKEETRNFYIGLVKAKNNDFKSAYEIFDKLFHSKQNNKSGIAINRFYAHIGLAQVETNLEKREKGLWKALEEWIDYEKSIPEVNNERALQLQDVEANIHFNKLNIYHQLRRHEQFDQLFSSMDKTRRLQKHFFELRLENYIERGHYEFAKALVNEAITYHQTHEGKLPEFIQAAVERLEDEDDYKRLKRDYLQIVTRSPEKLVLILPENIVKARNLSDYILKEICDSANDVLDLINSVEQINLEDKYTDLLLLSLQSKFRNWYWKLGNARGGFSDSNKRNNGELDFVITAADNSRIATCEALLLHGKNTNLVTKHVIKTFNYDHRRKLFFIIAYYNGKDFENHWQDYQTNIIPNIQYPQGFPLVDEISKLKELYIDNSIRALLVRHKSETLVYHIFININYRIPVITGKAKKGTARSKAV